MSRFLGRYAPLATAETSLEVCGTPSRYPATTDGLRDLALLAAPGDHLPLVRAHPAVFGLSVVLSSASFVIDMAQEARLQRVLDLLTGRICCGDRDGHGLLAASGRNGVGAVHLVTHSSDFAPRPGPLPRELSLTPVDAPALRQSEWGRLLLADRRLEASLPQARTTSGYSALHGGPVLVRSSPQASLPQARTISGYSAPGVVVPRGRVYIHGGLVLVRPSPQTAAHAYSTWGVAQQCGALPFRRSFCKSVVVYRPGFWSSDGPVFSWFGDNGKTLKNAAILFTVGVGGLLALQEYAKGFKKQLAEQREVEDSTMRIIEQNKAKDMYIAELKSRWATSSSPPGNAPPAGYVVPSSVPNGAKKNWLVDRVVFWWAASHQKENLDVKE